MNTHEIEQAIEEYKVIAIVRKVYGEDLLGLAQALCEAGIRLLEVTFDQTDPACLQKTPEAVARVNREFGGRIFCGCGTVLDIAQTEAAAQAGARYIISPNVSEAVIRRTKELGLVSIPGAMTPTEINMATGYGADYAKVFPASDLGPAYIKSIRAPLGHVKMIATGGITAGNLASYLKAGSVGAGVGGSLTDSKLIGEKNFAQLQANAKQFVEVVRAQTGEKEPVS